MILRRITEHVNAQNWFAVWLDFVIVVAGVFIGIQVANWNETRNERKREELVLRNIATDLRLDIDQYSDSIDGTLDKIAAISLLLDNANVAAGRDLTEKDLEVSLLKYDDIFEMYVPDGAQSLAERAATFSDELWSRAILVANAQPSATALDSLVSAGELGILQDEALVKGLQDYQQHTAGLLKAQEVTFRPSRDRAIDVGHEFGLSPYRGVDKDKLLALVSGNPKLAATIQTQLGWAKGHLVLLGGASNKAKALLRQIEGPVEENQTAEAN